eukprot:403353556
MFSSTNTQQGFFQVNHNQYFENNQPRNQIFTNNSLNQSYQGYGINLNSHRNIVSQNKKKLYIPVTCKQLRQMPVDMDDICLMNGDQVQEIVIIGRTMSCREDSMRFTLEINDSTEIFKVVFFQKDPFQSPFPADFKFQENIYVKIFGTIRVYKEEKAIIGSYIKNLVKSDEITNHLLQVFCSEQLRQKGVLKDFTQSSQQSPLIKQKQTMQGDHNTNSKANCQNRKSLTQSKLDPLVGKDKYFKEISNQILELMLEMRSACREMHKDDIIQVLDRQFQPKDIKQGMRTLVENGLILRHPRNLNVYKLSDVNQF